MKSKSAAEKTKERNRRRFVSLLEDLTPASSALYCPMKHRFEELILEAIAQLADDLPAHKAQEKLAHLCLLVFLRRSKIWRFKKDSARLKAFAYWDDEFADKIASLGKSCLTCPGCKKSKAEVKEAKRREAMSEE